MNLAQPGNGVQMNSAAYRGLCHHPTGLASPSFLLRQPLARTFAAKTQVRGVN